MTKIEPLTAEEILDNGMTPVWREADDSWRHGSYVTEVYEREADHTFWMVQYQLSTDGETNELREGCVDTQQCWPKQVTQTVYTTKRDAEGGAE